MGHAFTSRLLPRLSALPGVQSAAVMALPTSRYGSNGSYWVEGRQPRPDKAPESVWALSSSNYFATLGAPLPRGRDFTARDSFESRGAAIVSESLAKQTFPGQDPIGQRVVCGRDEGTMKPMTIVGVVGDVRGSSPGTPPEPMLYMPLEQHRFRSNEVEVILRTAGPPAAFSAAARDVAQRVFPEMAMRFTTLDSMIAESISAPRFRTFFASVFAIPALLLAMAGVYGVMSYVVASCSQEPGLRMALGAAAGDVVRLVIERAARLALAGVAIGGVFAWAASRLLASMLFGLKPRTRAPGRWFWPL